MTDEDTTRGPRCTLSLCPNEAVYSVVDTEHRRCEYHTTWIPDDQLEVLH
jgi:hypothetical protein